jgi:hypothetical protein
MKAFRLALLALAFSTLAYARPAVIEEAAVFNPPPDTSWEILGGFGVAIDGDQALVSGERWVADPAEIDGRHEAAFFLYQRSGTTWTYVSRLGPITTIPRFTSGGVAMKDGVAVTISDRWRIWERTGSTWALAPVANLAPTALTGPDIEIHNGRILAARRCVFDAVVLRKFGTTWMPEGELIGGPSPGCLEEPQPAWLDLHGERAAVVNTGGTYPVWAMVRQYRLNPDGAGWSEYRQLPLGDGTGRDRRVALTSPEFIGIGGHTAGVTQEVEGFQYPRGIGNFTPVDWYLDPLDVMSPALERVGPGTFALRSFSYDRGAYVYHLFRGDDDATRPTVTHIATLQSRSGASLGTWLDISGNRILVSGRAPGGGNNTVRVFELPSSFETPAVQSHDFENAASASLWQRSPGSAFSVRTVSHNNVFRQTNIFTDAAAWLPGLPANHAIQAQVTIRGGVANASRAGVTTRYTDQNNHYFAVLGPLGRVELRRITNGVYATLGSIDAGTVVDQKYWLRLESIGTVHRVYLDDRLLLEARDATLRSGSPGIITLRAEADFDNVLVSPSPFTTIYADDFESPELGHWDIFQGVWQPVDGVLRQSSTYRFSRISTGAVTDDQIVRARIRPTSFVTDNNWVGLFGRFGSEEHYLYVSLHQRGVIAVWRRVGNEMRQLHTRALPVSAGTWYDVRLEVINDVTRVFVDDRLMLWSTEDPGPNLGEPRQRHGQVGLITYQATADFDDFVAHQP